MPRGDGTGPRGEGPMTGGGQGYCGVGRGRRPWGGERGRAWGGGRGRLGGYGPRYGRYPDQAYQSVLPENEKKLLTDEIKVLQEEMNQLKKYLEELEKEEK